MKLSKLLLIAVSCPALVSYAQDASAPPAAKAPLPARSGQLEIKSAKGVPFLGGWRGKGRCDRNGNLYVVLLNSETWRPYGTSTSAPILRIKPDGTLAGAFKVTDASPELQTKAFFVSSDGKVFQAAWSNSQRAVYVLTFDNNGRLRSKIRVDTEFFAPDQIVVFESGEFLLSGVGFAGRYHAIPVTGVFDTTGRLIKKIYEPEDEYSRQRAEAGDLDFMSSYTRNGNTSVWRGDAALGSDGNAYLLRATSPALIYVISPKGEVVRKLRIDSPGAGLKAQRLNAVSNQLAISFLEDFSFAGSTKVVDYQGNLLGEYTSGNKDTSPLLPGCYDDSGTFTFVSTDSGTVRLHKAGVK